MSGPLTVRMNLVRNYSPHLAPNTSTAPPTVELRAVLRAVATDMLKLFLRKWRAKQRKDGGVDRRVNEVCVSFALL
jgi:vacuolar protein sorting-associated protein 3